MSKLWLLACVLLTGCTRPLTNQEIVEHTEYCRQHGLGVQTVIVGWTLQVGDIQCDPHAPIKRTGDATTSTPNSPAVTGDGNVIVIDGAKAKGTAK